MSWLCPCTNLAISDVSSFIRVNLRSKGVITSLYALLPSVVFRLQKQKWFRHNWGTICIYRSHLIASYYNVQRETMPLYIAYIYTYAHGKVKPQKTGLPVKRTCTLIGKLWDTCTEVPFLDNQLRFDAHDCALDMHAQQGWRPAAMASLSERIACKTLRTEQKGG